MRRLYARKICVDRFGAPWHSQRTAADLKRHAPPCGLTRKLPRPQLKQKCFAGHAQHAVALEPFFAAVQQVTPTLRIVFGKACKCTNIFWTDAARVLHFDGEQSRLAVNDEVNFSLRTGLPIVQLVFATRVIAPDTQMLGDQVLQRSAIQFALRIEWAGRSVGAKYSRIKK